MVVVNGILTSYYPQNGSKTGFYYHQNGIAKIHKLEFKAFRGDLMSFSDIIKKRIKPNLTDRKKNRHLITNATLVIKTDT